MAQNKATILNKKEKLELTFNIVIQLLRGLATRNLVMGIYEEVLPTVLEKAKSKFSPLSETDMQKIKEFQNSDKYFNEILMQAILSEDRIKKYTDILMNRNFVFYKIYGSGEFVTSDNTVMFVNAKTLEAKPFANGLLFSSTVIYYPLSPKLLLVAYHPAFMMNSFEELDCKLVNLDYNIERNFLTTNNRLQKEQCDNYVYAHSMQVLNCLNNS